jgi:hypothetical protein
MMLQVCPLLVILLSFLFVRLCYSLFGHTICDYPICLHVHSFIHWQVYFISILLSSYRTHDNSHLTSRVLVVARKLRCNVICHFKLNFFILRSFVPFSRPIPCRTHNRLMCICFYCIVVNYVGLYFLDAPAYSLVVVVFFMLPTGENNKNTNRYS